MKLTIFGASGRTGTQLVHRALERGDDVTAVLRRPAGLDPRVTVRVVPDFADTAALRAAIEDSDAVLSAIGPRSRKDAPVAAPATRRILAAGPRRIVVISAAPVAPPPADDSVISRRIALPIVSSVLRPVYDDLREMEAALAASDSVWTAFRPPLLTNGKATGRYRTRVGGSVPRSFSVSRADLADAMLASLGRPETERQPVGVAA
ncbi:NAD(P)-dependent oxidoreductase [Leifsonia shinshuensis]|uniref:NAD(P)H-binding protein n=1 Tax=Leifsonia shinshuensis TaxID=150026 RepID=A0A7G6YDR0_9MICO|nr:NAD(P)H-binding protein [Leifsonia shinshuensis]QNE36625.1 NAD(P)H-binding protein [Leifsonia shinshuensis]